MRDSPLLRRALPLLLVTWLGLLPLGAQALDFKVGQYQGRRVMLLSDEPRSEEFPRGGQIRRGDAQRFAQALEKAGPVEEIILASRGGSEPDGLAIGRLIREKGLATRIMARTSCASACADAFLGGVIRRIEPGGRYGVHMHTMANNPEFVQRAARFMHQHLERDDVDTARKVLQMLEQEGAKGTMRWVAFVLEMGASPRLVDFGIQTSASEITVLTPAQLRDFNVVNVVD